MTTIQCRCGAVKVELTGEPVSQFFCHCDDCQAAHGAAYIPIALYPTDAVKVVAGTPKSWKLRTMPRMSCPECGTRIFAEPPGVGMRGVVGALLPEGKFKPTFHIQTRFAVRPVRDELPHFKGLPAAFGGTDETIGW